MNARVRKLRARRRPVLELVRRPPALLVRREPALVVRIHDGVKPHAKWYTVPIIRCTAGAAELVLQGRDGAGNEIRVTLDSAALVQAFEAATKGRRA